MHHELHTLKNNLQTLFINSPGSNASTIQIWFKAGSALENKSNQGIAHFLEHMFFKGTPKRPGSKIAHDVESFGGEINAFTSFDYTCYYINCPKDYLLDATEILLDMVSNPEFLESELLPEREVVFEEYRRSLDSPNQYNFSQIQKNIFTNSYSHQILGTEQTIKSFSREQLIDFRKSHYNLQNSLLVVAGNLYNKNELTSKIEEFKLPSGTESDFPEFQLTKNQTYDVHQKDVRMATLTAVIQAPYYDSNEASSEDLAINCLGFGETSRLYKKLVLENTLANSASASSMFMNKGGAHFFRVSFPIENTDKVFKIFHDTIINSTQEAITSDEIEKIKNQYLSSKVYEKESIESFAFSLGHSFAQTGEINSEEIFINKIKNCTVEQVNQSLKNILLKKIHLSLQIPKSANKEAQKKKLKMLSKSFEKSSKNILVLGKSKLKAQTSQFDEQAKLIEMKNGIKIFYRQNLMTPTFVLQAYIRGGLTEETKANNGFYQLLSSTMTKGYKNISSDQIKKDCEEKSASLNGFSGKNAYGLLLHGQTEHFQLLIKHFFGSILNPNFEKKHLIHENKLILRALENQKEDPVKTCFKETGKIFFGNHPYSLNPLGTKESLKKITTASLKSGHLKNLNNQELLISYCGDLSESEIIQVIENNLSHLKTRKSQKVKLKTIKPVLKDSYINFNREQTQIFYGIPTKNLKSSENKILKFIITHLSGQSSELFVEVRDRQGLCYSAQPVHFLGLEGGYFGIYMASGHDKVDQALAAIKKLIEKIRINGLSKDEFDRVKKMIRGQNQINVQTNDDFSNIYSIPILQGERLDYFHLNNIEIEKTKYDDFQKELSTIFSRKWTSIVVGKK